jgi:hypothetical protein
MIRHLSLLLVTVTVTVTLLASEFVEGGQIDNLYQIPDSSGSTKTVNFDTVANLDLDQRIIVARLAAETDANVEAAKAVFEFGTYSDSYALLTILDDVNDSFSALEIPQGTIIDGQTSSGAMIQGKVLFGSSNGNTTLDVHYVETGSTPSLNVCRVGGNPTPITTGCKYCISISISISRSMFHFYHNNCNNGPNYPHGNAFVDCTVQQTQVLHPPARLIFKSKAAPISIPSNTPMTLSKTITTDSASPTSIDFVASRGPKQP